MSRIGKKPVVIPKGVDIKLDGHVFTAKGPKGELEKTFHADIGINVEDAVITVTRPSDTNFHKALHGMTRALIANMIEGVTNGFTRELEMVGVGYRGELKGKKLMLHVGYSHPVLVDPPDEITLEFEPKKSLIRVLGIDKELVGLIADRIRSIRKPEPYKGKGIRYVGEYIRRKAGKTAA